MDELAASELELHDRGNQACPVVPTLHSFLAGCVSGVASIVAGQPFDTVKVRLQTSKSYRGPWDCLRQLLAKEGASALFKGMSSPVLTASLVNAVVFSSYNEAMALMMEDCGSGQKPTYGQVLVAGAVAGGVQCAVLCPTELVKCRLQVETDPRRASGLVQCARAVYREGGLRGFYAGLGSILLRDVPAFATYFSLYEVAKDRLEGQGRPLWLSSCAAGGLAGVMSWVVVYPLDTIKSVIQTRPLAAGASAGAGVTTPAPGMVGTARELLRAHGPRVFFRGMSVALLRALPVNCIVFPVYEASVGALGRLDPAHRQQPHTTATAATEFRRAESLKAAAAGAAAAGAGADGAAAAAATGTVAAGTAGARGGAGPGSAGLPAV